MFPNPSKRNVDSDGKDFAGFPPYHTGNDVNEYTFSEGIPSRADLQFPRLSIEQRFIPQPEDEFYNHNSIPLHILPPILDIPYYSPYHANPTPHQSSFLSSNRLYQENIHNNETHNMNHSINGVPHSYLLGNDHYYFNDTSEYYSENYPVHPLQSRNQNGNRIPVCIPQRRDNPRVIPQTQYHSLPHHDNYDPMMRFEHPRGRSYTLQNHDYNNEFITTHSVQSSIDYNNEFITTPSVQSSIDYNNEFTTTPSVQLPIDFIPSTLDHISPTQSLPSINHSESSHSPVSQKPSKGKSKKLHRSLSEGNAYPRKEDYSPNNMPPGELNPNAVPCGRLCFEFMNTGKCQRMATGSVCRYRHLIASHPDAIADRFRSGLLSEEEIKQYQLRTCDENETNPFAPTDAPICFEFLNHGFCSRTAAMKICRYRHLLPSHPDAIADRNRVESEIKNG